MSKRARLALRLFGERTTTSRIAIADDTGAATPICIASRKARALLYFVAMQKENCATRAQLATLLWEDHTDALARQNLRQSLVSLRESFASIFPDLIIIEGDVIRLRRDCLAVDAVAFTLLAAAKEFSHLQRAVALYGGEFLAGNDVPAAAFCDWVDEERTRLHGLAGRVFQEYAQQCHVRGNGEQAIDAATRLVGLDPLREDWQRLLLEMYARHRGREPALAHARAVVALLRKELGVEPSSATKALVANIEQGVIANQSAPVADAPRTTLGDARLPTSRSGQSAFLSNGPLARLAKPSIAVLPFDVMGSGHDGNYFAEGLHIDIISALSNIRALTVISRDSTLVYAGRAVDARQIGPELDADYLVKGSIRQADERMRVTIELIDARTGYHIFTRRYDMVIAEVFAAQDEIAAKFSSSVEPHIYAAEASQAIGQPLESLDARCCTMRALALINSRSKRNYALARKLLQRAVGLNPDSAQAYSLVAYVTALEVVYGWAPRERPMRHAHDAALQALLRDPQEPWAHFALGFVQAQSRSTEQAIESFNRALALNPNFSLTRTYLGSALSHLGRSDEALEQIDEAERLSLREFFFGVNNYVRANAYFAVEKHELAAACAARSVQQSPGIVTSHRHLVVNHTLAGEAGAAEAALRRLRQLVPGLSLKSISEALPYSREIDQTRFLDAFHRLGVE
jgi:TolB-like protein/DNA-binding SARP family transcriptional activator